ncbi:MAG: HNH endonuclease [Pseudonocardia sp.]|nr:HNH endonuclease [Pseudonocardia sp.]
MWRSVVTDIARQYARRAGRDLDAHPEERFPRAALRRHVEARDRACVFMGCRAPAGSTDQDHTVDVERGGATVAADLGLVCRHDHRLKHEAGWHLQQPEPGTFVWTSPLGRVYRVRPEPIAPPLPDPVPRDPDPFHDEPADDHDDPLSLRPPGRAPPTEPAPDTPPVHLDGLGDQPPF